jgi:phasin family protein
MAAKKSATTPARNSARVTTVETVADVNTPAAPIEAAPVETASIEDVVGVSPAIETLTTSIAELPRSISDVMTELTKTQTEVKTSMDKAIKSAEDIVSFNQGNVEAFIKSSQIWATGLQDLSKHFAATAQAQIDETVATVKALSSVKSLKEAIDLQTALTKTAFEKAVAEGGKITDASVKLAEQALAPLTARVTLAAEKFGRAAA